MLEHQKTQLILDAGRVVGMICAVALVARSDGSALSAVWAMTLVTTLFYVVYWSLSRKGLQAFVRAAHASSKEGE